MPSLNVILRLISGKTKYNIDQYFKQLKEANEEVVKTLDLIPIEIKDVGCSKIIDKEMVTINKTVKTTVVFKNEVDQLQQEFCDYQNQFEDEYKDFQEKRLTKEKGLLIGYKGILNKIISPELQEQIINITGKLHNIKGKFLKITLRLNVQLGRSEGSRNEIAKPIEQLNKKIRNSKLYFDQITERISDGEKINKNIKKDILFCQDVISKRKIILKNLESGAGNDLVEEVNNRKETDREIRELYDSIEKIQEDLEYNQSHISEVSEKAREFGNIIYKCSRGDYYRRCTEKDAENYRIWLSKRDIMRKKIEDLPKTLSNREEELKAKVISRIKEEEEFLLKQIKDAEEKISKNKEMIKEDKDKKDILFKELQELEEELSLSTKDMEEVDKKIKHIKKEKEKVEKAIEKIIKSLDKFVDINKLYIEKNIEISDEIGLITKRIEEINDRLINQAMSNKNDPITEELYESIDQANSIDEVTELMKEVTEAIGINDLPKVYLPSTRLNNVSYDVPLLNSTATMGITGGYPALN